MDETKVCGRCEREFPRSEFGTSGKSPYCSTCRTERSREYQRRPERREYKQQWEDANREKVREQSKRWREANREKHRAASRNSMRKLSARLRQEALDRYGRKCACCGESEEVFLALDHINDDGWEERKENTKGLAGWVFYRWLASEGWPDGYQMLCHNCNYAKHRLGRCPHQQ